MTRLAILAQTGYLDDSNPIDGTIKRILDE